MPPTISRREQVELDELLSDIYRGIETLPDQRAQSGSYLITRNNNSSNNNYNNNRSPQIIGRAEVREFEVPESSPLVRQHKQAIAAARAAENQDHQDQSYNRAQQQQQQPQRSTLKRQQTGGGGGVGNRTPDLRATNNNFGAQPQTQSLASFLNGNPAHYTGPATPENRRRVRIVDHPEKLSKEYASASDDDLDADYAANDYYNDRLGGSGSGGDSKGGSSNKKNKNKVKYVNTNKLIYHQERDFNGESDNSDNENGANVADDDDDIDGVTNVEYYHTTWLDRQLGRASKRRSSKELNERQVKEKAMIEELKRNLKNGAITLRQSLKGKKGHNSGKNKASDIFDDHNLLDTNNNNSWVHNNNNTVNNSDDREQSSVVKTGIATLPRKSHHNQKKFFTTNSQQVHRDHKNQHPATSNNNSHWSSPFSTSTSYKSNTTPKTNFYSSQRIEKKQEDEHFAPPSASSNSSYKQPAQTANELYPTNYITTASSTSTVAPASAVNQPVLVPTASAQTPMQSPTNYHDNISQSYSRTLPHKKAEGPHQLLQSHYRGNLKTSSTLNRLHSPNPAPIASSYNQQLDDKMRNPSYNNSSNNRNINNNPNCDNLNRHGGAKSPLQQAGNTISGMPSATEVVRSALSRSNSQVSLNQLNKTINLLPNSPPAPSPMTPTQQLRAATPSLSPSPVPPCSPTSQHPYSSKTLGHQHQATAPSGQQQYLPGQIVLHGSRTVGRPPQTQTQSQAQQQPGANNRQQQQQHQPSAYNQPQQQQQQSVYANPHASLMQHRMEQQMKQPNRNVASIREFNELDSLLRSLSPGSSMPGSSSTHITPGFSSKPTQASLGGYMPANYQQHQQQQQQQQYQPATPQSKPTGADLYAKVQKQPANYPQQAPGSNVHNLASPTATINKQPYTIDVSDKKLDENCIQRERQDISEFESPIELLPSMEDYQNIAKLNPVKNHYWYKPNMSRDRAISLLKDKPQGTFIVRDSTSFRGAYGLAVKVAKLPKNILANLRSSNGDPSAEYIRHFLIEPTGSGVRLKGYANEPVFDSLPDLIYQHSLTELALPCRLIIPRADIEDPRFNMKQKQFFDEFIASKEQAKHQPYERTSPDGGYRKYPGDVYVHNEHRIIFE